MEAATCASKELELIFNIIEEQSHRRESILPQACEEAVRILKAVDTSYIFFND